MLTLSRSAVEVVDGLLNQPDVPEAAGLRIHGGAAAHLSIEIAREPAPEDQVIEEGGARVFVDSEVAGLLDGAELDARREGDLIAFGVTPSGFRHSSAWR